ncbi:hypothetical protein ABEW32_06415 [Paenibacillus jamilae]|uniref:hypothetical protein n=1 Tax=Paenibacillus jamilae TaxID=114136 RepID=UPI003D2874E1
MRNKYQEIMNRVQVTPQMHSRIMDKVNEICFDTKQKKWNFQIFSKRGLYVAACFVFLIGVVFALPHISDVDNETPPLDTQGTPPLDTQGSPDQLSIKDLSSNVGYQVKEVSHFPFTVDKTSYFFYGGNMAETVYSGENKAVTFRMDKGNKDVSGNYNEFKNVKEIRTDSHIVTMKGNKGLYSLAIWQLDHFSYSLEIDHAVTESEMLKMVQSVR